jgi:DNA-binding response OmpR family regulator
MNQSRPKPLRILLVEPNKGALGVMASRLADLGYRVIACDSARAAVAELYRVPVDLILAELRMAGMSGIDLVRLVRDDGNLRDTPVVLITGRSDANGAIEGFAAGADDVVAKPFDFAVLAARIARRLARARSVRELRHDNAALDARVVQRAIELGELRAELERVRGAAL